MTFNSTKEINPWYIRFLATTLIGLCLPGTVKATLAFAAAMNVNCFRALQLPPEAWLRMSLRHGSITWVSITSGGRVALRALGDCGYMPADKLSVMWFLLIWLHIFFLATIIIRTIIFTWQLLDFMALKTWKFIL